MNHITSEKKLRGRVEKIRAALRFGNDLIEAMKADGRQVPALVFERQIELYEELAEALSIGSGDE